ncbi:hypothetical protein CIW62_11415 [Enterobacter cloacae]|nr:VENN motif pre-toxin domain-containing protein [Enterobacter cloacae]PAO00739.1 hypothetical protein CIW62_11415 [Enterobacter cloacae]
MLTSALATISAGMAGGLAGDSTGSAVAGGQAGKNAAENNSLAHVLAAAEKEKPGTIAKYQAAREAMCKQAPEACRQAVNEAANLGLDFVPIVGDIKGFHEAETALDYLAAAIGLIPGAGDVAGKTIKAAEKALKAGDVETASKLINKASDEVYTTLPMGSKRNPMNQPSNPSYQPVRNQPATISNREYSGHALDRMQDRGVTPSVVENTIKNGQSTPGRGGTTVHFDPESKISVVTNETGRVVTVKYGNK